MGAKLALTSSDAELVQRCLGGDQQAWADVVRSYSRRIYNLAYRFTSSHGAAEDLTQEVFIRVYRSLGQYDAALGDLSNWLMRLARNLIIDDYRKRQRTPTDSSDDLAAHEYHLSAASDSPHRSLERQERRVQVITAIHKLSPDLRECV
ncbi:MAG: sigma-70 family RNA polymerase sigma factor, partial [Blastocatellia bacterium]